MESTPETDKTTLFFLSPRAASISIICHCDIADSSKKRKLWKGNEKTKICGELELHFGGTITRKTFSMCWPGLLRENSNPVESKAKIKNKKRPFMKEGS